MYNSCYKQGNKKIMCWVGVVDGRIRSIHRFEVNGSCASVNDDSYLDMLNNVSRTVKHFSFTDCEAQKVLVSARFHLVTAQTVACSSSMISLRTVLSPIEMSSSGLPTAQT